MSQPKLMPRGSIILRGDGSSNVFEKDWVPIYTAVEAGM
jgi:hypothetical protein